MSNADVAAKLRALAARVRNNLPRRNDPERFHIEKDEIARELLSLAVPFEAMSDREQRQAEAVRVTKGQRVQIITGATVINGKRVTVQRRRMPFAISIG